MEPVRLRSKTSSTEEVLAAHVRAPKALPVFLVFWGSRAELVAQDGGFGFYQDFPMKTTKDGEFSAFSAASAASAVQKFFLLGVTQKKRWSGQIQLGLRVEVVFAHLQSASCQQAACERIKLSLLTCLGIMRLC